MLAFDMGEKSSRFAQSLSKGLEMLLKFRMFVLFFNRLRTNARYLTFQPI